MKREEFSSTSAGAIFATPTSAPKSHYQAWGKRALDLMLCVIALPAVLVVCVVLWVFNLGSKQKLIFAQDRVGKNGDVFKCYKFQTMVDDAEGVLKSLCDTDPQVKAEWAKFQKLQNDPRITKVGHFLRKTSLDELPQFLNVLRGDMSLVGPRPFMESQVEMYVAAGGKHYFKMRPGITGNWQVEGRGSSSFLSRIAYDRMYYTRHSLREDARLIGRTVQILLRMNGH